MPRNIHVVGADPFNMQKMYNLDIGIDHRVHELLSFDEVKGGGEYPVEECLELAEQRLAAFDGTIDAIVGYWDFPVTPLVAILCRRHGLPTPSLESVLRCDHKYWSRLEQARILPEFTPRFTEVDPFKDEDLAAIDIPYPFWIKPVKGTDSLLAFRVGNDRELRAAIEKIRARIHRIARPFDHILSHAQLPEEIARVRGHHCIVEELIRGRQCTVEGYVHEGQAWHHGIIDSINYPGRSSFFRYQYPSQLPRRVRLRLADATQELMTRLGYDHATYNVEYFYQPATETLRLLEINPRLSQSHSDIFEKVDGASNFQIMVELALGRRPDFPVRQGRWGCAAKFHVRVFEDGVATHVPGEADLERIRQQFPGTLIEVKIREGMRLSDLLEQDSYSYDIAHIHTGAASNKALLKRYNAILREMHFEFAPIDDGAEHEAPQPEEIRVQ